MKSRLGINLNYIKSGLISSRIIGFFAGNIFVITGFYAGYRAWFFESIFLVGVGVVFICISIFKPSLFSSLFNLWTKFGESLSRISNPIIMGALFFLLITPTAYICRIMGRDPLRLKKPMDLNTYWVDSQEDVNDSDYFRRQY